MTESSSIPKRPPFPRWIIPLSMIGAQGISYMIANHVRGDLHDVGARMWVFLILALIACAISFALRKDSTAALVQYVALELWSVMALVIGIASAELILGITYYAMVRIGTFISGKIVAKLIGFSPASKVDEAGT
jgi:hypothetical protein